MTKSDHETNPARSLSRKSPGMGGTGRRLLCWIGAMLAISATAGCQAVRTNEFPWVSVTPIESGGVKPAHLPRTTASTSAAAQAPEPRVVTRTRVKTVTKTEKVCPSKKPIELSQEDIASLSPKVMMQIDQHNQEGAAAGCW
jgi:hypothetical protein